MAASTHFRAVGALLADAFLFEGEHVVVDEAFVGVLDQFLLFGLQFAQAALVALAFAQRGIDAGLDEVAQALADVLLLLWCVGQAGVVVDHRLLDLLHSQVGGVAVLAAADSGQAGEVLVDLAGLAAVPSIAESASAAVADEGAAGEVVLVFV